jgi:hypothetical protein
MSESCSSKSSKCSIIILIFLALGQSALTQSLRDNSENCTCYAVTSGDTQQYFQYHRFYDFRYLANSPSDYLLEPELVTNSDGSEQTPDPDVLNSTSWKDDWGIVSWGKGLTGDASVVMRNSPGNVFISTQVSKILNGMVVRIGY